MILFTAEGMNKILEALDLPDRAIAHEPVTPYLEKVLLEIVLRLPKRNEVNQGGGK